MSTLTIQMPESLVEKLRECAAKEGVTVDQLLSSAAAEKLSALITVEHLRQRALREAGRLHRLSGWIARCSAVAGG